MEFIQHNFCLLHKEKKLTWRVKTYRKGPSVYNSVNNDVLSLVHVAGKRSSPTKSLQTFQSELFPNRSVQLIWWKFLYFSVLYHSTYHRKQNISLSVFFSSVVQPGSHASWAWRYVIFGLREVKNLNFYAADRRLFFCATFKTAEILSDKQLSVAQWPGFKCFQAVLLLMLVSKTTNRCLVCNRDMKLSDFHSPWRFHTPGCR